MKRLARILRQLRSRNFTSSRTCRSRTARRRLVVESLETRRLLALLPIMRDSSETAPSVQLFGTWTTENGSGYGGSVLRSSAPANSTESIRWNLNVPFPGTYQVSTTWNGANATNSNSAQFFYVNGSTNVNFPLINQQIAPNDFIDYSVNWEYLGLVTITSTTFTIGLNEGSNGHVVADTVRLQRVDQDLIIDSSDPSTSRFQKTGTWNTVAGQGGYGNSVTLSSWPIDGSETAKYIFSSITPSMYRIAITWHAGNSAHASNAPVSVFDGTTLVGTIPIDQRVSPGDFAASGVTWETVGMFPITGTTLSVTLSDNANGYVLADAVRIERLFVMNNEAIVDNNTSGFSRVFFEGNSATAGYGSTHRWSSSPYTVNETAEWAFYVEPGTYRVSATWPSGQPHHGANLPLNIFSGTQLIASTSLNQKLAPDDYVLGSTIWEHVGVFTVGSILRITLNNSAAGIAIADAMRIQRVASNTSPSPVSPVPVAITNPSFESQVLPDGGTALSTTGWAITLDNPAGYQRLLNPNSSHMTGGLAAHGSNIVFANMSTVKQTLSAVVQPNKEYRLRVSVGDRLDELMGTWRIELRSGNEVLAWMDDKFGPPPPNGGFTPVDLVYTSTTTVPSQPLEIRLTSTTGNVSFDDVSLTMVDAQYGDPIAQDDLSYYTPPNTDLVVTNSSTYRSLLSNDVVFEQTSPSVSIISHPTRGILKSFAADGTFTYQPDPLFSGIETFTYRVIAGSLQSTVATARIAVGTRVLPRVNKDSNPMNVIPGSEGLGQGFLNVPSASSAGTDGTLAKTGGLLLSEDILPGMSLVYRSDSLVRPIIEVESQFAPSTLPSTVYTQLAMSTLTSSLYTYSTSGIGAGEAFRVAIQLDASSLATGMYDYQFQLNTVGPSSSQTFTGKQAIINRTQSVFGAGWSLAGLDRVIESAAGLLLVAGHGDFLWFPKQGNAFGFADGDTNFTVAIKNADGTYTLRTKTGDTSTFSTTGLLVSIKDRLGDTTSFAYADRNGDTLPNELISITEPYGRVVTFNYANGRVSSIHHYSGRVTTLAYGSSSANLVGYTLTDPDGTQSIVAPSVAFQYTAGTLTGRTNAVLETTNFGFDPSHGRLSQVIYPNGDRLELKPSEAFGLPGASTNFLAKPQDVVAEVKTNNSASLVANGTTNWKFRTDRFGNITKSITTFGNVRETLRNVNGQAYLYTDPDPDGTGPSIAPVYRIGYNSFGDLVINVAPDGGTTRLKYSENLHQVVLSIDPVGRTQRFQQNHMGNDVVALDGAANATTFVYNNRGLVTGITSPDPDGVGPLLSPITTYAYDTLGRMTSIQFADGSTNTVGYNSADQVTTMVDELGKTTVFGYDNLGRNTSVTNRLNKTSYVVYDAISRPTKQIDAISNTTDVQYDSRGRVSSYLLPDPDGPGPLPRPTNVIVYDERGNVLSHMDEGGLFTALVKYEHDFDDRIISRDHPVEAPLKETYEYDNIGRLINVNRASRTDGTEPPQFGGYLRFEYDAFGRVIVKKYLGSELSFEERFVYNGAGELVQRIDGTGNVANNLYDARGLLIQETMPDPDFGGPQFPLTVKHTYDNLGRPVSVDRGFGRVTTMEYNNRHWLTKVTQPDPDGTGSQVAPVTQFGYNLRGDQTSVLAPLGRLTTYTYDDDQRLVSQSDPDPDGNGPLFSPVTTWAYNEVDWLVSTTDAVNATTSFLYDFLGRTTRVTQPDPDGVGPLTSPVTNYTYGVNGLTIMADPLQRVTSYQRDGRGRITVQTDTAGSVSEYDYNFYDQVTRITAPDPDGLGPLDRPVTKMSYDEHGHLKSQQDPLGHITSYTYDGSSNLTKITDPSGNLTTFTYDGLNRRTKETNSMGSRKYVYDVAGNLTRTVDRNERVIQYVYDNLDRQIEEKWIDLGGDLIADVNTLAQGTVVNEQQTVGWNATNAVTLTGTYRLIFNGQYTSFLPWNADSSTVQAALDAIPSMGAGNIVAVVTSPDPFSRSISLTFRNAKGGQDQNQITISTNLVPSAGGTISPFQQTVTQGVTVVEQQRVEFQEWIPPSHPTHPPEGFYATLGNLQAGSWRIAYGEEVSPLLPANAGAGEVMTALNNFQALDGVTVSGTYNSFIVTFGNGHTGQNMSQLRVDYANRRGFSTLRTIASSYNTASELTSVSDPSATINYTRDNLGRATTVQNVMGNNPANQFTFHQDFDAVNQRTELRAVKGTTNDFRNTYTYDKLGRLTEVKQTGQPGGAAVVPKRVTLEYNSLGQRTKLSRFESTTSANPVGTTDYGYDFANRLVGIEHKQGTTNLNTYSYGYDFLSRITTLTSTLDGTVNYTYDKNSQITVVDDQSGFVNNISETQSYDANGNRTKPGYLHESENRTKTSPGGVTYHYDDEGNVTQIVTPTGGVTYTWDHRNRLVQVSGVAAPTIDYEYDAFNRLVRRYSFPVNSYFGYDEGINPHLHTDTGVDANHRYLWSDQVDELFADEQFLSGMTSANTKWAMSDHLGTIRDIADYDSSTGVTTVNHRRYDTFGNRYNAPDPTDIVFGYTGKYYDEATGLQNNWNRWYSPKLGRFISQDPIGFAAGDANLYRYTGNSPINRTDPSGLDWWESEQEGERDWNSMGGWNPWGWSFPFGQQQILFYAGGGWSAANRSIELERQHRAMIRLRSQSPEWDGNVQNVINSYRPSQCEVDGMKGYAEAGVQANASLLGGGLIGTTSRSGSRVLAQIDHLDELDNIGVGVASSKPSQRQIAKPHTYVNPGHHVPGTPTYVAGKSVLPTNHVQLFNSSVAIKNQKGGFTRWAREGSGKNAVYHRFDEHCDGEFHWNGSTNAVLPDGTSRPILRNQVPIKDIDKVIGG